MMPFFDKLGPSLIGMNAPFDAAKWCEQAITAGMEPLLMLKSNGGKAFWFDFDGLDVNKCPEPLQLDEEW